MIDAVDLDDPTPDYLLPIPISWHDDPIQHTQLSHRHALEILRDGHSECPIPQAEHITPMQQQLLRYIQGKVHYATTRFTQAMIAPSDSPDEGGDIQIPIILCDLQEEPYIVTEAQADSYLHDILEVRAKTAVEAYLHYHYPQHAQALLAFISNPVSETSHYILGTTIAKAHVAINPNDLTGQQMTLDETLALVETAVILDTAEILKGIERMSRIRSFKKILNHPEFQLLTILAIACRIEENIHVIDKLCVLTNALYQAFETHNPQEAAKHLSLLSDYSDIHAA